jgi:hypothetical protein
MEWLGEGTHDGLRMSTPAMPSNPDVVERRKPVEERSRRYQRNGLTMAKVAESWRGEDHGVLRCGGN